jgi:hypothetical protein
VSGILAHGLEMGKCLVVLAAVAAVLKTRRHGFGGADGGEVPRRGLFVGAGEDAGLCTGKTCQTSVHGERGRKGGGEVPEA